MAEYRNMTKEISPEPVEILPENIGDTPAIEAASLLERGALRTEVLGWKGEFWDGLRENLRGAAAWIKTSRPEVTKRALAVVTTASFVAASLSACAKGPNTPYVPSGTGPRTTEVSPYPTLPTIGVTQEATQSLGPTNTAEVPTPIATPDRRAEVLAELNAEIQPVSDFEVSGESHGVPISVDFITSALMQDKAKRGDKTFSSIELNDKYPIDPKQAVLDATFLGLYYAWRDNDPAQKDARASITPDQFADLWKNGGDVTIQLYAYDAMIEQFPHYRWDTFDPRTMSIKVVYIDYMHDKNKLIPTSDNADSDAYATIFTPEGLQLWIRTPVKAEDYNPSFMPSECFGIALERLTWPEDAQTRHLIGSELKMYNLHTYRKDIGDIVIFEDGIIGVLFGVK